MFSPPSGLDLGFRIWVLPNKGLEWTSAVSAQRASARSPLNPVLSRQRWWNNMESSFEGQAAVTALAFLAGGDAGNRLALLPGRTVVCFMRALSL